MMEVLFGGLAAQPLARHTMRGGDKSGKARVAGTRDKRVHVHFNPVVIEGMGQPDQDGPMLSAPLEIV